MAGSPGRLLWQEVGICHGLRSLRKNGYEYYRASPLLAVSKRRTFETRRCTTDPPMVLSCADRFQSHSLRLFGWSNNAGGICKAENTFSQGTAHSLGNSFWGGSGVISWRNAP